VSDSEIVIGCCVHLLS